MKKRLNLKERKEGYIGGPGGRKGKREIYIIISEEMITESNGESRHFFSVFLILKGLFCFLSFHVV